MLLEKQKIQFHGEKGKNTVDMVKQLDKIEELNVDLSIKNDKFTINPSRIAKPRLSKPPLTFIASNLCSQQDHKKLLHLRKVR